MTVASRTVVGHVHFHDGTGAMKLSISPDNINLDKLFENEKFIEKLEDFLSKRNVATIVDGVTRYKSVKPYRPKEELLIQRCRLANVLWQIQSRRETSTETFLDLLGSL